MKKVTFRAMGCQISAMVESNDHQATQALENVPFWFEEWEQSLSRFRLDSELSWINQHQGVPVSISQTFMDVLCLSLEMASLSGGLVTPTVLNALKNVGYDRSFDEQFTHASPQPVHLGTNVSGWEEIRFDTDTLMLDIPFGVSLDFGGVAKGWAAHTAMKRLMEYGPALVDAGGDIAISESLPNGDPWPIEVADSLNNDLPLGILSVLYGGVATSGTDFRRWKRAGKWMHHIIDPRTGYPAQTDIISTTITSQDVMKAEMAAKTVLIMGSQEGFSWLEERTEYAGLIVLEDGEILYTPNLKMDLYQRNESWM
jgi:FAD:protein FMN transferase